MILKRVSGHSPKNNRLYVSIVYFSQCVGYVRFLAWGQHFEISSHLQAWHWVIHSADVFWNTHTHTLCPNGIIFPLCCSFGRIHEKKRRTTSIYTPHNTLRTVNRNYIFYIQSILSRTAWLGCTMSSPVNRCATEKPCEWQAAHLQMSPVGRRRGNFAAQSRSPLTRVSGCARA